MQRISRILGGVFIAILLIIIVFFSVTLLPIQGNIQIKIVKSGSMEPALKTGGIVAIKPSKEYKVGDIITFGEDTRSLIPTTHRVVGIDGDTYSTKGDANDEVDPEVIAEDNIIGKVLFTVPYIGFIIDFARQPKGFIMLVAIPTLLIVSHEVVAIWEEMKKIKSKKNND
ncbi:MAG: signal peptidase I [Candidatus Taylorbacteria bacterium]|nr:signal peptidase I [Candidatus Taylorbacteria bacterium]